MIPNSKLSRVTLTLPLVLALACGGSDDPAPATTPVGAGGTTSTGGTTAAGTGGTSSAGTAGSGGTGTAGTGTAGTGPSGAGGTGTAGSTTAGASGTGGSTSNEYPAGPYGNTVGKVFPNLAWEGYANTTFDALSTTKTYGPLTMKDLRALGKKWALVTLAESYCPGCQKTATQLKDAKPVVDAGGMIIEVLITTGFVTQPTKGDLDAWIKKYDSRITVVMDPPGGGTVSKTALGERENGFIIDLDTMKIVETIKGSNSGAQPTVGEQGLAKMKTLLGL